MWSLFCFYFVFVFDPRSYTSWNLTVSSSLLGSSRFKLYLQDAYAVGYHTLVGISVKCALKSLYELISVVPRSVLKVLKLSSSSLLDFLHGTVHVFSRRRVSLHCLLKVQLFPVYISNFLWTILMSLVWLVSLGIWRVRVDSYTKSNENNQLWDDWT